MAAISTIDQSSATCWRPLQTLRPVCDPGSDLPFFKQGIKILGTTGHPQFVEAHPTEKLRSVKLRAYQRSQTCNVHDHSCLMRIRKGEQLFVKPSATREFAQRHNEGLWKCSCEILHVESHFVRTTCCSCALWQFATLFRVPGKTNCHPRMGKPEALGHQITTGILMLTPSALLGCQLAAPKSPIRLMTRGREEAFASLEDVELKIVFSWRVHLLRTTPRTGQ